MIDELDEVLRQLLIRELPVKNAEVDIAFNQPSRAWSARISKPTLNLYLYDLRENTKLRMRNPAYEVERTANGTIMQKRMPIRLDVYYMIMAWATEPEDEHRLMSRAIMALTRFANIPADLLPESFSDQPASIPILVAQHEILDKPADVWGALDNELKPSIGCLITIALNPYKALETPVVRTAELRFGQSDSPPSGALTAPDGSGRFMWITGQVKGKKGKQLTNIQMMLVERGVKVPVQGEGQFIIGVLPSGVYTLEVSADGVKPGRFTITVPSKSYDIQI